jgi:HD-GYP domain-containing protein (c-di-GMP phosphodiesterase class II)
LIGSGQRQHVLLKLAVTAMVLVSIVCAGLVLRLSIVTTVGLAGYAAFPAAIGLLAFAGRRRDSGRSVVTASDADGTLLQPDRRSLERVNDTAISLGGLTKMMAKIMPSLTSGADIEEKLRLVTRAISDGTGYGAVNVTLFESTRCAPVATTTFARLPDEMLTSRDQIERDDRGTEPHPMRALLDETRRPVMMCDAVSDTRLTLAQRAWLSREGMRSGVVVPMIWGDAVIGLLGAGNKGAAPFGDVDADFLGALATQLASFVHIERLADDRDLVAARMAEGQADTVMMLAAAAEAYDPTTGMHLSRIRTLTEALARELGYSEQYISTLGLGAVLHDVGKISVPDAVLSSADRLDGSEWELMKRHTVWGADFLAGKRDYQLAAKIARSHHERWDGRGYPDGLAADEIPEAATIVTVADSFDAMTHDRPHRAGRAVSEAIGEMIACSGKQFSPDVVAALVRLYHRDALPESDLLRQVDAVAA